METLKPVEIKEYYINRVASGLSKYFWQNLFGPIFKILKDNSVINANDPLLNAIKSGRVYYKNGAFRTDKRFSNAISLALEKMGAKFRNGAYCIEKNLIPIKYSEAIGIVEALAAAKANTINTFLLNYFELIKNIKLEDFISIAVDDMYKSLQVDLVKSFQEHKVPVIELGIVTPKAKIAKSQIKSIERYWDDIDKKARKLNEAIKKGDDSLKEELEELNKNAYQNAPMLDFKIDEVELDERSKKIAQDYTYNMEYWVKKWEAKNVIKMREDVLNLVQDGARVPTIEEYFIKRWKIAKDKAHFLAVNESHLAGSVIKATQYQMSGCTQFLWGRSSSREKRKLHEEYYGKVFSFNNPPIIDEKLGIKGLPRQIWNCKCHMLAVLPEIRTIGKVINAKRHFIKKIWNTINGKQCNNNPWRYRRFGEG